jgi:hypothetical protein
MKGRNTPVKYLRCDNADEHQDLGRSCAKHGVIIDYTPPYTPQMNGLVEQSIAVDTGVTRTILFASNMSDFNQIKLRAKAKATVVKMRNLHVTNPDARSPFEVFEKKQSKLTPDKWIE